MIPKLLYEHSLNELIAKKSRLRKECISNLGFIRRLGLHEEYHCHDESFVNAIQFNETGDKIISVSDDMYLCVTDLVEGKTILTHRTQHVRKIFHTKYVPRTENEIVSAGGDCSVRHYHISSGDRVTERELANHSAPCYSMCVHSRNEVLSADEIGCVRQTDIRTDKSSIIVHHHLDEIFYSCIDSDFGNYFILSRAPNETWLYDLRNPTSPALTYALLASEEDSVSLRLQRDVDSCCKFNYNGSSLITTYNNSTIYLYDTHDNTEYKHKYTGHRNNVYDTVNGINFYGVNSEYVMSGSDCGHIFIWDSESGDIVQCLVGEKYGSVTCLEFNPYSPMIASSGEAECIKIWTPNLEEETNLADLQDIVEKNALPYVVSRW